MTAEDAATALAALAPKAPPCFEGRRQWVMWLVAVDKAPLVVQDIAPPAERERGVTRRDGGVLRDAGPLVISNGRPAFNFQLSYCDDCTVQHRSAMLKADRCNPEHLRALSAEAVT